MKETQTSNDQMDLITANTASETESKSQKINSKDLSFSQCNLCGESLKFLHVTNFYEMKVTERTVCTGCGVKTADQNHILQ